MPAKVNIPVSDAFNAKWERIYRVRADVQKALELKRAAKEIGKSPDAKITLTCSDEPLRAAQSSESQLPAAFIVSQVEVVKGGEGEVAGDTEGLFVTAKLAVARREVRALLEGAARSGRDAEHPTLCPRCAAAVKSLVDLSV